MLYTAAGATAFGGLVVGGAVTGFGMGGAWWAFHGVYQKWKRERTVARLRDLDGNPIRVQQKHLLETRLLPDDGPLGWSLDVAHVKGWTRNGSGSMRRIRVAGEPATRIAGQLMARVNRRGGRLSTVQGAVRQIEEAGHPENYLRLAARQSDRLRDAGAVALAEKRRRGRSRASHTRKGSIEALPTEMSLAIEMATQERAERAAMEGELDILEAAWRSAEEVAAISDDLLLPESVREFIRRERGASNGQTDEGGEG